MITEANILTRSEWGAKPAIPARSEPHDVTEGPDRVTVEHVMPLRQNAVHLTVHHSAFSFRRDKALQENLRNWQDNMQRGYTIDYPAYTKHVYLGDLPYHFVVDASGKIAEGRELKYAAYSNTHYITPIETHVTIVLDGDFDATQPTEAQIQALIGLAVLLSGRYHINLANIDYHKHVAQTDCPGKNLIDRWDAIKRSLSDHGVA